GHPLPIGWGEGRGDGTVHGENYARPGIARARVISPDFFQTAVDIDRDFICSRWDRGGDVFASRPADPCFCRRLRSAHYLNGAVLRAVAAPGVNLPHLPLPLTKDQEPLRAHALPLLSRPFSPAPY